MVIERYLKSWENDPELSNWLIRNDNNAPRCKWCEKNLTAKLSHLRRHARTSLHKKNYMIKNGLIHPLKKKIKGTYSGGNYGWSIHNNGAASQTPPQSHHRSYHPHSQQQQPASLPYVSQCILCKCHMLEARHEQERHEAEGGERPEEEEAAAAGCRVGESAGVDLLTERTGTSRTLLVVKLARLIRMPIESALLRYGTVVCHSCVDLINSADDLQCRLAALESKIRVKFSMPFHTERHASDASVPNVVDCNGVHYEMVCNDMTDSDTSDHTAQSCHNSRDHVTPGQTTPGQTTHAQMAGLAGCEETADLTSSVGIDHSNAGESCDTSENSAGVSIDGLLFIWQDGQLVPVSQDVATVSHTGRIDANSVVIGEAAMGDEVGADGEDVANSVNIVITDGGSRFATPSFSVSSQAANQSSAEVEAAAEAGTMTSARRRDGADFVPRYQLRDCKLTCRLCHFVATTNMLLHKHWNQCHPEKLLPCPCCEKKFYYRTSLNKHMLIHQSPSYFCELCNHPFVNRRDLRRHQLFRHTDLKRFVCHECGHRCKVKFMLTRHMRTVHGIGASTSTAS